MSTADSYRSYAADCVRQAEGAKSPEEKNVLLNMALAWIRLAHQKKAIANKQPHAAQDLDQRLDAVKEASVEAANIDAKAAAQIVELGIKRPIAAASVAQPAV